jgi:PAS domain S-box-containing protein
VHLIFPSGRADGRRRAIVVAISVLLFAAVFGIRLIVGESQRGVVLFFVIPLALLAMEFGLYGGLLGALVAAALTAIFSEIIDTGAGALSYTSTAIAFLLIGAVVGLLAARLSRVTELHERTSARRESEGLRSAIFDAAIDCLITIDATGRVLEFNPAAEETFGYERHEAVGRELAELIVPPELRQHHRQGLERCVETGDGTILDQRVELTGMRKDGTTMPVELAVTRVPATEPPVYAGYLRDVSARQRSEERARSQAREIAKLAEERGELVAQLLSAEERTRRRIAQALHDDALQRLLSAHQDLLDAAPGRAGVTRAHKTLEGTIDRLREAVTALHPVTLQAGDLNTALNAIAREEAARGGFRHTVRVEAGARGQRDDLVLSIVRELLTNVAQHARASRCSVSVARDPEGIRLEVADDGRGIPPGRAEAALRQGHVGLASAVQRVKALGGEVEISSDPGNGTVVRGVIPVAEGQPIEGRR